MSQAPTVDVATATTATGQARRRRFHPAVLATFVLGVVTWALLVSPFFVFANDDLYIFTVARQGGLTRHLIGLTFFEHFAPFNRFMHWFLLSVAPLDVHAGFAVGAVFMVGMLAAYVWLLNELRFSWQRQVVALIVLTVSIPMISVSSWWGQIIHIPTSLACIFLVLAAHVRAVRLHSWRWHAASFAFLVAGFTTQERALYAPLIAVFLDVFVVWRDLPIRAAVRRLWSIKWPFLALFAFSAVAGFWVTRRDFPTRPPSPHLHDVLVFFPVSLFKYFVPSLFGFYVNTVPMPMWVAAAVVVLTLVVMLRTDLRNIKPLVFLAVIYFLYYGLLALGRLGIYSIDLEASDLQYAAYVIPFLLVTLGAARWPTVPRRPVWRAAHFAAAGGLVACLLTMGVVWDLSNGMQTRRGVHEFLTGIHSSRPQWDAPGELVVPLRVPVDEAATWIDPFGREETYLTLIDPHINPGLGLPGNRMVVIDEHARVHAAVLDPLLHLSNADVERIAQPTPVSGSQGGGCYRAPAAGLGVVISLPRAVSADPLMVELDYTAPADTIVRYGSAYQNDTKINAMAQGLPKGRHILVSNLEAFGAALISITLLPNTSLCVNSLDLVRPLVHDGPGNCHTIDRYGVLGAAATCPAIDELGRLTQPDSPRTQSRMGADATGQA